jgi:hypothetical protein
LVSVVNEKSVVGQSHAFKVRANGPFKIVGMFSDDLNYLIVGLNSKKVDKIHYNRILPYRARDDSNFVFGMVNPVVEFVEFEQTVDEFSHANNFDIDVAFIMSVEYNQPVVVPVAFFVYILWSGFKIQ